jgi:F-type H+-transporting ATPase subunit b
VTTKDLSGGSATDADATQTQFGQDGGAHPNFPPFDPSTFPSQLVWFAIAFGFLYWYMSKRGLPQLGAVIDGRKAQIARDLDDATAMQQKADAAAAAHEKTLAEARAKAQSLAQAARDAAAADAQAKRKALEDELAAKLAGAEREIARMRADAMANVAEVARDAAGAIVERLGGRPADPASIAAAVSSVKSLSGAA